MKALVTGAAGFIGSTLSDRLLQDGWEVTGIDRFTTAYDPAVKRANVASAVGAGLHLIEDHLGDADLRAVVESTDVIVHLAAIPGVRASWDRGFDDYVENNITATQRLLETVAASERRPRVVYGSSSSVYGNADVYPLAEDVELRPRSPYGLTKLAAEYLVGTYAGNFDLETVSLRFFSVFGPRQRPDMGVHRLIEAGLGGPRFTVFGDGSQVRDMTFIDDIIDGIILAATRPEAVGQIVNLAGGCVAALKEVIDLVAAEVGEIDITYGDEQLGDVQRTGGTIERAKAFGFSPRVSLDVGIRRQVAWHRDNRDVLGAGR